MKCLWRETPSPYPDMRWYVCPRCGRRRFVIEGHDFSPSEPPCLGRRPRPLPPTSAELRVIGLRMTLLALALGFYDLLGQLLGVNLRTGEGMTPDNFASWRVRLACRVHRQRRGVEVKVRRAYFYLKRRGAL